MSLKTPVAISFAGVANFLGVIGIIGSLIFVALELRQSQRIAIAAQQQARTILRANQILSTYEFSENEIGVENIPWGEQSDLQRYIREQRQVYYWTINENNYYQYQIGLLDDEIWAKESQYSQMQWDHCHLRHVFEGQVFMSSYETYVRSLPDNCQNLDDYDGIIPRFE
tara:strand:- start:47 stop:553 length:507 start_codon:yes stop_codon:yes gene_type:complete